MNLSGGRRHLPVAVLHGLVSCWGGGISVLRSQWYGPVFSFTERESDHSRVEAERNLNPPGCGWHAKGEKNHGYFFLFVQNAVWRCKCADGRVRVLKFSRVFRHGGREAVPVRERRGAAGARAHRALVMASRSHPSRHSPRPRQSRTDGKTTANMLRKLCIRSGKS